MADFFKHETALVESDQVGAGTRIWAYAHVMRGAVIGEHCNICDHSFVEAGAIIGNNVTIKNGVAVWDKVRIEDGVFLGPNAALTNDLWPRSRNPNWVISETLIERGATVGANATIVCGIRIGAYSMIGAGAVVTRDVPAYGIFYGNPARLRGWVCSCANKLNFRDSETSCGKCGKRYRRSGDEVEAIES